MARKNRKDIICLIAAIVLVTASACYWFAYSINANGTFHTFGDVASPAYDMYYHIHYPGVVHGLQYLSFAAHLAPDQLLVLPIFYLYQSSLTLLLVQAAVLSLTGLLVFFVAKRLLKDSFIGLLLCFAYLINPGVHGLLVFDYHVEFLIIPFMLLTFYFFMERKRIPFLVSLLLLLGTLETAAFVTVALGVGLLAYELIYDVKEKKAVRNERLRLSLLIIVASIFAIIAYALAGMSLSAAYAHGAYPGLPPSQMAINFAVTQPKSLVSNLGAGLRLNYLVVNAPAYAIYGLLVVFLGFGIGALFVPEVTLLIVLPWLFDSVTAGGGAFLLIGHQYFSYVIGGALVAAILALMAIKSGKARFGWALKKIGGPKPVDKLCKILVASAIGIFMLSSIFIISGTINDPVQSFFFVTTPNQAQQIAQVYSMIALIPQNASVVAPMAVEPHLAERADLAPLAAGTGPWFIPQYILLVANGSIAEPPFFYNYTAFSSEALSSGNYSLYAQDGVAKLYRLVNDS